MTTTTRPTRALRPPVSGGLHRAAPRRPEHDAPGDMTGCLSHTLTDGTIYAISGRFRDTTPGPHAGMTVELFSQLRNPRIDREARTVAATTLPDGRRITATCSLGSLNFTVARKIYTRHLLPDLLRQAANPHRI